MGSVERRPPLDSRRPRPCTAATGKTGFHDAKELTEDLEAAVNVSQWFTDEENG